MAVSTMLYSFTNIYHGVLVFILHRGHYHLDPVHQTAVRITMMDRKDIALTLIQQVLHTMQVRYQFDLNITKT